MENTNRKIRFLERLILVLSVLLIMNRSLSGTVLADQPSSPITYVQVINSENTWDSEFTIENGGHIRVDNTTLTINNGSITNNAQNTKSATESALANNAFRITGESGELVLNNLILTQGAVTGSTIFLADTNGSKLEINNSKLALSAGTGTPFIWMYPGAEAKFTNLTMTGQGKTSDLNVFLRAGGNQSSEDEEGGTIIFYGEDNIENIKGKIRNYGTIKVASGATLTISNCDIDLSNTGTGPVFTVENGGNLIIESSSFSGYDGTSSIILVEERADSASSEAKGTVVIKDSIFQNNKTGNPGSGTVVNISDGTLTISGTSTFTNNHSSGNQVDGRGGGVIRALNSDVKIEAGKFEGNSASFYGGAIIQNGGTLTLGTENSRPEFTGNSVKSTTGKVRGGAIAIECECNLSDNQRTCTNVKEATLTINNALFQNNTSVYQAGAISLGYSGKGDASKGDLNKPNVNVHATIKKAEFIGNKVTANSGDNVAAGAILINSNAELYMEDAAFVNNFASNVGGAIASCMWGSNFISIPDGAAIYNNYAGNPVTQDSNGEYKDIYVMSYNDDLHPDLIGNQMFHEGDHNWLIKTGIIYTRGSESWNGALYGYGGSDEDKTYEGHKVLFKDNQGWASMNNYTNQYHKGNGGAIGNNGLLNINTSQRAYTTLTINKTWEDDNNSKQIRPDVKTFLENWIKLFRENLVDGYNEFKLGTLSDPTCETNGNVQTCSYEAPEAKATEKYIEIKVEKVLSDSNKWKIMISGLRSMIMNSNHDWIPVTWTIEEYVPESMKVTKLGMEYYKYRTEYRTVDNKEGDTYYFKNILNLVDISGSKSWNCDGNGDDVCKIPDSIKVHLHRNNECLIDTTEITVSDITLDTPGTWSFTDLPKYDKYGKPYNWEVHEEPIMDFKSERVTEDGKYNIKNTFNPRKISIEVEKHWNDGDNRDNTRPESITVTVKRDGTVINSPLTLNEENNWHAKLDDIENTGTFTIEEVSVDGYTSKCNTIEYKDSENNLTGIVFELTNTLKNPKTVKLEVTKSWDDNNNIYGTRPMDANEVLTFLKSVRLYAGDVEYRLSDITYQTDTTYEYSAKSPEGENLKITVTPGYDTWTLTCEGLPMNGINQEPIDWRLKEGHNKGYKPFAAYSQSEKVDIPAEGLRGNWNETKQTYSYNVTNSLDEMSLTIIKHWVGDEDVERPTVDEFLDGIQMFENGVFYEHGKFYLKKDEATDEYPFVYGIDDKHPNVRVKFKDTETDTWTIIIDHLPKRIGNTEITWSAEETLEGYESSIIGNRYTDIRITNTYNPPEPPSKQFFRLPELPKTGFSAVRPTVLSAQPLNVSYVDSGLTLQVPSLDVKADIVTVPFVDGEYPVEWLGMQAGMLEGSAKPGEGMMVLTGHNTLNSTEAGPFAFLSFMEEGDMIFLLNRYNQLKPYTVYAVEKIGATDSAALERIASMDENSLTMLTCEDELPEGGYASRRVVAAKPVGTW